jgi:uncharacterized protein (DUF1501 family)
MYLEFPRRNRFCDGLTRRDFFKVGAVTAAGFGLPNLLGLQAAGAVRAQPKARSVILLFMGGGASHLDTFDLKPDAPAEIRGGFNPIATNVPGIAICERLPLIARQMDRVAVLRSVHHETSIHEVGAHYMLTGWMPSTVIFGNEHPSLGSVVAREKGGSVATPYVVLRGPEQIVNRYHGAAFLEKAHNPLTIKVPTFADSDLPPPEGTTLSDGLTTVRMDKRRTLLHTLDIVRRQRDLPEDSNLASADRFQQKALDMVTSSRASAAFDLSREPEAVRDRFGRNLLGQGCLLARRLVEAGVCFVTISRGGWDTHANNHEALDEERLPELDQAFSALLQDLHDHGLLESTLVIWSGEFGRTPKINKAAGRDHWPNVMTLCLAGGGVRGGQVLGASDARAELPAQRPVTPEDVWATMFHLLGIDWHRWYKVPEGFEFRAVPGMVPILPHGEPIPELF